MGYGYHVYSKMEKVDVDRSEVLTEDGKKEEFEDDVINVALFGTDSTEGTKGLSDSNMILTVNTKTKSIKLSSIMRDTYVQIPGHGENIINMAMADGGPELSLKTINTNFNLDLDKFIAVNLNSLPKIIDRLDGIDMIIEEDELKFVNQYTKGLNEENSTDAEKITSAGMNHLNGTQATAYCRIRYTAGTDFKRTERQRTVFSLIFKKLSSLGYGELNSLLNDIIPLVSTNLSYGEIISIGSHISSVGNIEIIQNRFPNDGDHWSTGTNEDYRLNVDKETTAKKMNDFIYG
jgi:LCP family protein required for cell wall assembly